MSSILAIVLAVIAVFLILLVLVQRGRGGGLTGALGGMGGSSAFGAKAGDVFTRITIVTAAIWIVVCLAAVYWAGNRGSQLDAAAGPLGSDLPITGPGTPLRGIETPPSGTAETPPSEPTAESPPADVPAGEAA